MKRPAWRDMSTAEIQKRADALKLTMNRDFFARQQPPAAARADALNPERAAVDEMLDRLSKTLTPAQFRDAVCAYSKAIATGAAGEALEILARADAAMTISGDGLIETITLDASNRPVHTFRSISGKKRWMNPYRAVPALQIALTNNPVNTRKQAQRYLAEHPEAELV